MKTKIYLVIFLMLVAFAAYTVFDQIDVQNLEEAKSFKVEQFEEVTKIIISDKKGHELFMEKQGEKWILNKTYPIRMHLFEEMKEALTKMEAISPVPKIGSQYALKQMIGSAIVVQVFKGKQLDKKIYIGGPNLKNDASHMFLEIDGKPAQQIYNVSIPGFRGFLTTRFSVDPNDWRSKVIFDLNAKEIKTISVNYTDKSSYEDFTLTNNNSEFNLKINNTNYTPDDLRATNIVNYLNLFKNQQVTSYIFDREEETYLKDSLMNVNKYADLTITDTNDETMTLSIINMPRNESSKQQYDENGDPMLYDVDYKFVAFGPNNDWGVITNAKFGLSLVSPYLFLKNNIKPKQ